MKKLGILLLAVALCLGISALGEGEFTVNGSYIFGSYEQDNNLANGAEPIEWIVLDVKEDGSAVLISKYGLDEVQYNNALTNVTWENSTMRQWLNGAFFNTAFTEEEQSRIQVTHLENKNNPFYGTPGGNDTDDKVFLLSYEEAFIYAGNDKAYSLFADQPSHICYATAYCIDRGASPYDGGAGDPINGACWWWLRSSGKIPSWAGSVSSVGYVFPDGSFVSRSAICVRPVIVITAE